MVEVVGLDEPRYSEIFLESVGPKERDQVPAALRKSRSEKTPSIDSDSVLP